MDQFPILGQPDTGDTAWMLASSALVLLMTPGLAFFYGGMVRAKGVLNMLMMSISAMGVVTVLWVLYGYSMSFGNDVASLFGNPTQYWGLKGLIHGNAVAADATHGVAAVDLPLAGTIPQLVFVMFQLMFAIITVALVSGAVADRLKFGSWLVFAGLWATLVYFPVAHWVFSFDGFTAAHGGWIANKLKAIDFAGGTAVHINSGAAGLALCIVLGKRKGWPTSPMRPHNLPFVMLGAGLLWFGWYGFNAGSAVSSGGTRGVDVRDDNRGDRHRDAGLAARRADPRRSRRPRSVRHRASSPGWSPSRRPVHRSTCLARSWSASSAARSVLLLSV